MMNDENERLRVKAHYAINQSLLLAYVTDPTEENFSTMYRQMEESIPLIQDQRDSVDLFEEMLMMLFAANESRKSAEAIDDAKVKLVHRFVGDEFRKSKDPYVWSVGTRIHDRILVGNTDFVSLRTLLTLPDEQSVETLQALISNVAGARIGSPRIYRELIQAIDSLSQSGRKELAAELLKSLEESVSLIQDEVTINQVELMFEMLVKRKNLDGATFTIRGVDVAQQPVEEKFRNQITVIVFFSMRDVNSVIAMNAFKNLSYLEASGVQFIGCCGDAQADPKNFAQLVNRLPGVTILDDVSAEEYLKRCPVSFVPYILILDREHKVMANNPLNDHVRRILERMVATSPK